MLPGIWIDTIKKYESFVTNNKVNVLSLVYTFDIQNKYFHFTYDSSYFQTKFDIK